MLQAMVYRKSLRLQRVSKGNATNLMNVDSATVLPHPPFLPSLSQYQPSVRSVDQAGKVAWFVHRAVSQPPQFICTPPPTVS